MPPARAAPIGPAIEQQHHYRFAGGQHRLDQVFLPAHQVEACAVSQVRQRPCLPRGLLRSGRPWNSSTTTGLPVASIALTRSSCRPTRSRLARSPKCANDHASREVCSLPPMASTTQSALRATLTASAICLRSVSGSLAVTSSCCQEPPTVILQPSL